MRKHNRHNEPIETPSSVYAQLFQDLLPPRCLKEAEDGKGVFGRDGLSNRELSQRFHMLMDKMTDFTSFPNKTTLLESLRDLYMSNVSEQSLLWTGAALEKTVRVERLRAEALAGKKMLTEAINTEKHEDRLAHSKFHM